MAVPSACEVIYLHGFASSPRSRKAEAFSRALRARGIEPIVPDLNAPSFRELTISRQLAELERLTRDAAPRSVVLIGSSLGGYTSALFASASDCVAAAVLMAPAFDFARRWSDRLGADAMEAWRRDGQLWVDHYGTGRRELIGYGLMEDAAGHPAFPAVAVPTLVIHGRDDDTVFPDVSERFARDSATVTLELVDADHTLAQALDWIVDRSLGFLGPLVGKPGSR